MALPDQVIFCINSGTVEMAANLRQLTSAGNTHAGPEWAAAIDQVMDGPVRLLVLFEDNRPHFSSLRDR